MAIIKERSVYEYLTRFNADGTVRGQHIKYIDKVYDDVTGQVYAEIEGEAKSVGDAQNAIPLAAAIGEVAAGLAKAEQLERDEKLSAQAERDEARAEKTALQTELNGLKSQRGRP